MKWKTDALGRRLLVRPDAEDISFDGRNLQMPKEAEAWFVSLYPEKDVPREIKNASRWLIVNGEKKNYVRFLVNWLNTSKDKYHTRPEDEPRDVPRTGAASEPHKLTGESMRKALE